MTAGLTAADRLDLVDLVHRYAAAVDERAWAAAAALFVPAGRLVVPDPPASMSPTRVAVGGPAIRAVLEPLADLALTVHHVTGSTWTVDGTDHARGRSTCLALHVERGEKAPSWTWHLVYADHAVRTAAGWLLAERELHLRLVERGAPALVADRPSDAPDTP